MEYSNASSNDITPIENSCKDISALHFLSPTRPSGKHKKEVLTTELDPINLIVWTCDLRSHREIDDE